MDITMQNNSKLTSSDISNLWSSYIFESMVHHIFSYFINTAEDYDVKTFAQHCHFISRVNINHYINIFNKENLPIPRGTSSEDINLNAPPLFSDAYVVTYIKNMAKFALTNFAISYAEAGRDDIKKLFREHLIRLEEVDLIATEIMVSKGIFIKAPSVQVNEKIDFVKKNGFFSGFFGSKRSLSFLEIKQLFLNLNSNAFGKALMMGFAKSSKSKEVFEYMLKGKEIAEKYHKTLVDVLLSEDIPASSSYETEVKALSSSESPFSDRLILNHVVILNSYGIANYGMSLSQSQRVDLTEMYAKFMLETGKYAAEGADILIDKGWLEQPPLVASSLQPS